MSADIRTMEVEREVVHTLEGLQTGVRLGEQRSRFTRSGDRLKFDVVIRYDDGTVSTEQGAMSLADGYRAIRYRRVNRRNGVVESEVNVDFPSGRAEWLIDGERLEKRFTFSDDTYAGPMLAFVLGTVEGATSFEMLTFRPDPRVYTIRVDVVGEGRCDVVQEAEQTKKLRLKADLGPVGNTLFEQLIPTHYFWYTQADAPEFFAFEGQLGHDGPDLMMYPAGLSRNGPSRDTVVAQQ